MTFILKGVIGKVFFKEGPSQRCHFATHSNLGKTLTLLSHSVELPASARVIVTWFSLWATTPSGSELAVKLAQSSPSWPYMGGLWKPSGTSRKKGKEKVSVVRAVKEVLQSRIPLPGFLASWLSLLFWEPWQIKKKKNNRKRQESRDQHTAESKMLRYPSNTKGFLFLFRWGVKGQGHGVYAACLLDHNALCLQLWEWMSWV